MTLSVTAERMDELHTLIASFLTSTIRCSSIALLSLVGKLSFAAACLPGARPFMRRLLDSINHRRMRALVRLTPSFYIDLRYWHARLSLEPLRLMAAIHRSTRARHRCTHH